MSYIAFGFQIFVVAGSEANPCLLNENDEGFWITSETFIFNNALEHLVKMGNAQFPIFTNASGSFESDSRWGLEVSKKDLKSRTFLGENSLRDLKKHLKALLKDGLQEKLENYKTKILLLPIAFEEELKTWQTEVLLLENIQFSSVCLEIDSEFYYLGVDPWGSIPKKEGESADFNQTILDLMGDQELEINSGNSKEILNFLSEIDVSTLEEDKLFWLVKQAKSLKKLLEPPTKAKTKSKSKN